MVHELYSREVSLCPSCGLSLSSVETGSTDIMDNTSLSFFSFFFLAVNDIYLLFIKTPGLSFQVNSDFILSLKHFWHVVQSSSIVLFISWRGVSVLFCMWLEFVLVKLPSQTNCWCIVVIWSVRRQQVAVALIIVPSCCRAAVPPVERTPPPPATALPLSVL